MLLLDALAPVLHGLDLIVDVAPSPQTSPLYRALCPRSYVRLDLDPAADGRDIDIQASLTHLPFADHSVSAVVCYHVLEHIADDAAAMREIARVLTPDGLAIVQVPWRRAATTDEDPAASRDERIRRFGRSDHVRYYGSDFEDRLRAAGLRVRRISPRTLLGSSACTWMNLQPEEPVWLLRSSGPAPPLDAMVHTSGAFAALLELLMADNRTLKGMLAAASEELRLTYTRARRWWQYFGRTNDHWVLRSYRTLARPAARNARRPQL